MTLSITLILGYDESETAMITSPTTAKALQREIQIQMKDLSLEGLLALREFVAYLRELSLLEQPTSAPVLRRPTVEMPVDSLLGLMDILPSGGGDALADTEALYDQV